MSRTITIGPYHPFLLEPEVLDLKTDDGIITGVEVTLGWVHRAIERLLTTKTYRQGVFLAERICGICSNVHTLVYCQAVEKMFGIEVPDRALFIRTVAAELERLHSHYLTTALLAQAVDLPEYFARLMAQRESVMALLENISGNRVHLAINTIGGTRVDLSSEQVATAIQITMKLEDLSDYLISAIETGGPFGSRVEGIGVVDGEGALKSGAVGPVLRGSGIKSDIRRDEPYAAYGKVDFEVIVEASGDVRARAMVRAREILASIAIIRQALDNLPEGPVVGQIKKPCVNEVISRAEAPRGELIYHVKSDGSSIPARIKVRAPTYANVFFLKYALKGENVENARPVIESIDPCFACTDR